jgi:ATP-binding cassette, subfamily B, bacterial
VPNTLPTAFDRVFPSKDLFRGKARSAIVWSTLATILLAATISLAYFIADLLDTQGRLVASLEDSQAIQEFLGEELAEKFQPTQAHQEVIYEDAGLLATAWNARNSYWGSAFAAVFRNVSLLQSNSSALWTLVLLGALLGLLRSLWAFLARRMCTQVGLDVAMKLRKTIHQQRLRLGPGDLVDTEAEQVLHLFTVDVDRVREGISGWVRRTGEHPFTLVTLLVLAVSINWLVTLECLIPLAFCWYLVHKQKSRALHATKLTQNRAETELRRLAECLQKTRLVRGYNMERFESEQFQTNLDRLRDDVSTIKRSERVSRWINRGAVTMCVSIVVGLVGMKILQRGGLNFSEALVLMSLFVWMYKPLEELWERSALREDAGLAADRIYRYLDKIPSVGQAVGAKFLQPLSKMLTFDSVCYNLPNRRPVLDGLDLRIAAGSTVSIVSLDDMEPRALAYLLPRFIEPHKGRVLFDGEDIAWVTLESLRAETIFVGASDPFFTGTVRENICCGKNEYPMQDATAAAKQAHANKFILDLPQGYETMLGEHGEHLDVGQGFRLGLARAILRNPALMIVEEPGETLDNDTKTMLDDTYSRMTKGRTTIFLPTRLSTVRRTDLVVLLHRGKVAAVGSHAEVVKSSEAYRHWEYLRYNAFRKISD